jgi:hypothetical protein
MYRDDAAALAARRDALARELAQTDRMLDELRGVRRLPRLPNTQRASRCGERWDEMKGDERVRSCDRCQQKVYNFSAMTREQAESLILEREGELCARYYQRADGSILFEDCWIGAQRWRRIKTLAVAAATTVGGVLAARGFIGELQDIHERELATPQIAEEEYTLGRSVGLGPEEPDLDAEIDATLSARGEWIVTKEDGRVWRPSATVDAPLPAPAPLDDAWLERMEGRPPSITDALPTSTALDALFTRMHRRR